MSANPYDLSNDRGLRPVIELAGWFAQRARGQRYRRYLRTMKPQPDERVLDLGCGRSWSLAELDVGARVTGVDLVDRGGFDRPHQQFVVADACELPFDDDSFDIGYSNSLVEHIARERRPVFAAELRRVARRYWVQTPNYWFPLEPHALLPGLQFLPPRAQRVAWGASPRRIDFEPSLRLLSRPELASLFGDALILEERIGRLVKSLVAVGPRELFQSRSKR